MSSPSTAAPPPTRPATGRKRAPSFSEAVAQVPQNANARDETADPAVADRLAAAAAAAASKDPVAASTSGSTAATKSGQHSRTPSQREEDEIYRSQGLIKDLLTFRWMTAPASSLQLALIFVLAYFNWNFFIGTPDNNPIAPFLMLSHRVPQSQVILDSIAPKDGVQRALQNLIPRSADSLEARYQKGYNDLLFLVFYVIVFSFLRQSTTLYIFKPFAKWWGIKSESKQARFTEQGYAVLYWGSAAALGLYVMSFQDSWWYNLEHLWLKYPHWQMRSELKLYYLLQFSFWLQQALVMLLRLEKPRKDYYELIAHHLVTLWLIGWSYLINLTMIGTTVFVCMDIPDTWLGFSKALNYMGLDNITVVIFAIFMVIWTYFRIYLSAATLHSVWYQFELIPRYAREWEPEKGWWLVSWMRYQIFAPLFLLLLLNLFWYVLMWRIMFRAIRGTVADEREDGEDDEEEDDKKNQ
ncbi:longevity assurance proteins LAG1/LAC1 [Moesziomyces antarcticus]|uniref:Longevity assurance proteins LAG1/LAC1 n=2 Tax=Pseudozyma antarctica TaxID=84753 RepID=A0A081CGM9_PSEA2|nr:longevity assurance proteins LAG1/LAC1 [Moesziomyces antarcticus]GAK65825.1 longevity assurance proteins LAG1/LAC1 [Moesziomyces antarcticus]SPO45454.1 related to longevity-assurance protein LAG1 [Moesziomyces antarcticus]